MKRSHAVNSSFCEVNKARLAVSKDRRQVDRRQRKVVLQQLQGTHFFGLLRSVRSLARHRGGTAHRKAWPIALREEGCCKELPFFFNPTSHSSYKAGDKKGRPTEYFT